MKFKCVQTFSPEYLKQCRVMTSDGILQFLDDFSQLHAASLNPVFKEHHTAIAGSNSVDRPNKKEEEDVRRGS